MNAKKKKGKHKAGGKAADAGKADKAGAEQAAGARQDDSDEAQAAGGAVAAAEAAETGKGENAGLDKVAEMEDRYLRLRADFENFRSRVLREKDTTYRRANEDLMIELLPVMDHLQLALEAADSHGADPAFVEGFKLVSEQLTSALNKFGLCVIDAEGEEFDPNEHEAISHLPSEDVPENHVMSQVRKGYRLGDRLLRAAQVVVSSGPPETQE